MMRDEIDLQQSDNMDLAVEVSDQALEAACGGLMQGSQTLAFGSYCFTCRPPINSARQAYQTTANRWRWT